MIMLSFTKSEVKLDGEKADTKDNNYQNIQVKLLRIWQIDVNALTSSNAPVHQTLMLTDWWAGPPLGKPIPSSNSFKGVIATSCYL